MVTDHGIVVSTMRTDGDIEPVNPTKRLCAVLRLLAYERTSKVILLATMPWAWRRNSYFSGESQPAVVGGKVSSLTMWQALRES